MVITIKKLLLRFSLVGLGLGLLASFAIWAPALAQDAGWSQPVLVFEGQGRVAHPTIIADIFGQVHAFWVFAPDSTTNVAPHQLYYARLDRPDTQPIDIYLGTDNFASLAAAGTHDNMFLVWDGNSMDQSGVSPAISAQAWNGPKTVGSAYSQVGLTTAPDGTVWMVYGETSTNAVFVRHLDPTSKTWDQPSFVSNTSNPNAAPDAARISIGTDGTMHVVWTEYQLPNGWPPLGVYYSRSTDGGQNWTAAKQVGGNGFNQPNVKAGKGENVYITYLGMAGVGGKYFSQSSDDGETWSGAINLLNSVLGGGSEGAPNMVVDAQGSLHVLFSDNGCVWYMHLEVNGWTNPDCISRGVPTSHTEEPTMTLGLGNVLHVMWWTNDRQLWYMTRQIPIAGQSPQPTPTQVIATEVPPTSIPTLVPTATHLPDYGPVMDPNLPAEAGTWAVLAGIVPVLILLLLVYLRRFFR